MKNDRFSNRHRNILALFIVATVILMFKLMQLQLLDENYRAKADRIAVDELTTYPSRGMIYDRNGKLIVYNKAMYDLMVTYNQINPAMDTIKFCRLLGIDKATFIKNLTKNWRSGRYSKRKPFLFLDKISSERYARIQENLYEFPGFSARLRNVRGYPYPYAAHLLGYLREVNKREIEESEGVYRLGDYVGDTGLEEYYEETLRGKKGTRYILKDKFGREVESYNNGELDVDAVSGIDLHTSIDIELQQYCEELMTNRRGSIVAIEPSSGEVLSLLSAPTYDPGLLAIGQNRLVAYKQLSRDSLEPFFDRSVMAKYPPGSIFKTLVSLIALEEEIILPDTKIGCPGYYQPGPNAQRRKCHLHEYWVGVPKALQYSCNAFYFQTFREIVDQYAQSFPSKGLDVFTEYLNRFGLGVRLEIDYPRENGGLAPSSEFYDKRYDGNWNSGKIMSVGIGQGEIEMTTLQMANLAAIIGNRGLYYTPHLVRGFSDSDIQIDTKFREQKNVNISSEHFEMVIDGMERVVNNGTARTAQIPGIAVCGKTGTSQNAGKDHSVFFAFAPKEDPKIAIAVYIENGGAGGSFAAPIASLVMEKYLKGKIENPVRKWQEAQMLAVKQN